MTSFDESDLDESFVTADSRTRLTSGTSNSEEGEDIDELSPKHLHARVRATFTIIALTSLTFWVWAIVNCYTKDSLDFGVISFLFGLLSSILILSTKGKPSNFAKYFASISHGLISVNYALGAIYGLTEDGKLTFGVYCLTFTFLWGLTTVYALLLVGDLGEMYLDQE